MLKEREPRQQRTWNLDYKLFNTSLDEEPTFTNIVARWSFKGEVVPLTLILIKEPDLKKYEMARHLSNIDMVNHMVDESFKDQAFSAVSKGYSWIDVFWIGLSPAELEEFCTESLLPLPPQYREVWEMS